MLLIIEFLTTTFFGTIAFKAYLRKQNSTENDSGKIQRIISLSGLNVKDGKDVLTTQLIRKKQHEWGWEYKFRIPLGRSFDDYLSKQKVIADGLNNRRKKITLNDIKSLNFDNGIINSFKKLQQNKLTESKEIELDFDGLLIIRVYDNPLPAKVKWNPGKGWKVPVGLTRNQNTFKLHDFEQIPHIVVGGATRYGKSNFINSMITSLVHSEPSSVNFYLIDLKGGVELCDYENIRQTKSIAYEPEEALQTLFEANEKIRSTQERLRSLKKKNVQQAGIKERYFVIVDEVGELNPFAETNKELKIIKEECQNLLSQIARLGAGLGFRLVTATQYPTGDVIPRAVKQNSDAKLSFRVQSAVASQVVLDGSGAELLPQIRGRAIYQTADKREILQTPIIDENTIEEIITPHIREKITKEKKEDSEFAEAVSRTRGTNPITFEKL